MKIIQNTLKIEKKSEMSQKKFWVGPKKIGYSEMRNQADFAKSNLNSQINS